MSKHSARNDRLRMKQNEQRSRRFIDAASAWKAAWPDVAQEIRNLPLEKAASLPDALLDTIPGQTGVKENLAMDCCAAPVAPHRKLT